MKHSTTRIEFGDFQTPVELATRCCRIVQDIFGTPHTVIEPTCGHGAFLSAAATEMDCQCLIGYELNSQYRRAARRLMKTTQSDTSWAVHKRDFFDCDWKADRQTYPAPILYLGNPPWVTNSQLGTIGSNNLPSKSNVSDVRGIDAMTGRSNFDIAESILQSLLDAMRPDQDAMAMLVKTATARKLLQQAWHQGRGFSHASIHVIDANRYFKVNVDACLLLLKPTAHRPPSDQCLQLDSLDDRADKIAFGFYAGNLVADPVAAEATQTLQTQQPESDSRLIWRSGVKHDLSRVVELNVADDAVENNRGERVDIENGLLYPLAKGADVANGRVDCKRRRILITQTSLSESTSGLAESHPKTWHYLTEHASLFAARKSSIYRNRDPFALFGIGTYTFAPWKVAVCGLYKRLAFTILGPIEQRPVIVDDTCYFLPLQSRSQAEFVFELLSAELTTQFLNARIFWDAKRPITAGVLRSLDLRCLAVKLGRAGELDRLFAKG